MVLLQQERQSASKPETVNDMRSLTWQRSQELLRVNVLSTGLRSKEVCEAEMSILHRLLLKGHFFKSEQIFLVFFSS